MNACAEKLLQVDPVYYSNCLNLQPDKWQRDFLRSHSKRIICNTSRQVGKSTTTATKIVHRAKKKKQFIIIISPTERQSRELMIKVEECVQIDPYLQIDRDGDKKLEKVLNNGSRVLALPGTEKGVRGFSAPDLIIIDEASRVDDALFYTVSPMLAVRNGDLIVLSTPFGKRGFFWDIWDKGQGWERYEIPATECPRMTKGYLEEQRALMGDWWFQQEYMCQFLEPEDSLFNMDDVMAAFDDGISTFEGGNDIISNTVEALIL